MNKFTLIYESGYDQSKLTYEFKEDTLDSVLGNIEQFLRGCGYVFTGELIVHDDQSSDPENDIYISTEDLNCAFNFSDMNGGETITLTPTIDVAQEPIVFTDSDSDTFVVYPTDSDAPIVYPSMHPSEK